MKQVHRRVSKASKQSPAGTKLINDSQNTLHPTHPPADELNELNEPPFVAELRPSVTVPGAESLSPDLDFQQAPSSNESFNWSQFLDGNYQNTSFFDFDSLVSGGQYFGTVDWADV
jgi:hypothetical protein